MKYRFLGSTRLNVSEIGLGCSSIGRSVFNNVSVKDSENLLNFAYDSGINFFDTADNYAYGNSEKIIGKTFKSRRGNIIISTKAGFLLSSLAKYGKIISPFTHPVKNIIQPYKSSLKKRSKKRQDFSIKHIYESLEKSLKRLRTDYIDLYLLHNPPSEIINEGSVFEILEQLKREGKIRFYGISAATIGDAALALNYGNVSALQIEFNMLNIEAARNLFPKIQNNNIGIIARVPLARGLLTKYKSQRTGSTKLNQAALIKKREKLENIFNSDSLSEKAIQFILYHNKISTVIPGTTNINHLKENIKAALPVSFSESEVQSVYEINKTIIDANSKE